MSAPSLAGWRRPSTEEYVALTAGLLLAVVVFANEWGVLTPDTKPEIFLNPWRTAADFARPWLDSPELGAPNYNVGVAPVAAVMGVLQSLGAPAWVAQRLWRVALLLIAAAGARALYRQFTAGSALDTPAGRLAAAFAYAANPYVVVGGGTTPTLLPYALLPWFLIWVRRATLGRPWRNAAAAALVLAATSGLNAAVATLVELAVLVPLALYLWVADRPALHRLPGALLRTGLLYAALSLYWAVPTLFALTRARTGLGNTESLESINVATSFAESLRGLGMWTLYGRGADGPFLPGQLAYLTVPVVVVLTFGGPLLAAVGVWLARHPARVFGAGAVVTGALLMSAPFPFADRSGWGELVVRVLDGVPGAAAFRTLNKAGGVLEIGLAVLIGLAAAALVPLLRSAAAKAAAALVAAALVAAGIAPAFTGGLFPVTLDAPRYWVDAAAHLNAESDHGTTGRVLLTPGAKLAAYDWGYGGPDELGNSLLDRPNVFRTTIPSSAPEGAALLGEVDRRLYQGVLPAGALSAMSVLAGVRSVLARFDTTPAATVSAQVEAALAQDPGLGPATGFGAEPPLGAPPVSVREVRAATDRALVPAPGALLVDGGPEVLPDLVAAGLTAGNPALLLAGALTPAALERTLRDGAHVILSDSNGRREWSDDPVRTGALLAPGAAPERTRALYTGADQTLALHEGNARISTSGRGVLFGPVATGDPSLAFDQDLSTAWQFGNFGTGAGNALTVDLPRARPLGVVSVRLLSSPGMRITGLRVRGEGPDGAVTKDVAPTEWTSFPVSVDLGAAALNRVHFEVTAVAGTGAGWVGMREIAIPGVRLTKVARMPTGLPRSLAGAADALVRRTPVTVVMHRQGGDSTGLSAEEPRLQRDFTLPDTRSYALRGSVRLAAGIADPDIDRLLGVRDRITADSSSRAFANPALRAGAALDRRDGMPDLGTAWIPDHPVVGEWISVAFPQRTLSRFTLSQNETGAIITSALVSIDDAEPFPVTLVPGRNLITLPQPQQARSVRVLLTGTSGEGFVRITDLGLPRPNPPAQAPEACLNVARLDGAALPVRLEGDRADLVAGKSVLFTACEGASLRLAAGTHRLRSQSRFAVDDLVLSAPRGTRAAAQPRFRAERDGPTSLTVTPAADCAPCYLSAGQNVDPAWRASLNGRDLGAPLVLDGYAAGWRVEARAGDLLQVTHAAAGPSRIAWWLSGMTLLGVLALFVAPRWTRRATTVIVPPRYGAPVPLGGPSTLGAPPLQRPATPPNPAQARRLRARAPRLASALDPGGLVRGLAWVALAGLVVWGSVGPLPAVLAAGGMLAVLRGSLTPRMLGLAGVLAVAALPAAWYLGPLHPGGAQLMRVGANDAAHQLAGLAVWIMLAAALLDRPRAAETGILTGNETGGLGPRTSRPEGSTSL